MDGVLVIAASAGGFEPLRQIITALPTPCSAAVFVVMHIGARQSNLANLLRARSGSLPVTFARHGDPLEAGHVYVAPSDHHMLLSPDGIELNQMPKVLSTRPAADPLFMSAAELHGPRVMGIVLSGGDSDGAAGLKAITDHGGTALVQAPSEAQVPSMPRAAIYRDHPDACLPVADIARRVHAFCSRPVAAVEA